MVAQNKCTGCGACMSICPAKAIQLGMKRDGFWYPRIDCGRCLNCNLCDSVCSRNPIRNRNDSRPEMVYAAYSKDYELIGKSSSGGAFSEIAQYILSQGGVVYGASQKDVWDICHEKAEDLQKLADFRKSKYLQSYEGDIYIDVKKELNSGRDVLYSGVGCQIAGLLKYLEKDYPNLITCEIVCHGVPSRYVFAKFLKVIRRKYGAKVSRICYRDKSKGWNQNYISLELEDGRRVMEPSWESLFHKGYTAGLYNRESCYQCQYACLPRIGDITLADYWMFRGMLRVENHNKGISLILCSTERGERIFQCIKDKLTFRKSSLHLAIRSCYHLTHPPVRNRYREVFMKCVNQFNFKFLINRFTK